ncbi:response regulator [bacterium]|nr:response regulator [bacterium]
MSESVCTTIPASLSVLIASPQLLFAEAMASALASDDRITVIGCCSTAEAARRLTSERAPDLLLIEVSLISTDISEFIYAIQRFPMTTRAVLLAENDSDVLLQQALLARVSGYLLKSESITTLLRELFEIAAGVQVVSRSLHDLIRRDHDGQWVSVQSSPLLEFNEFQQKIVRLLAQGCSVKEISKILGITAKAVDSQKYRIMRRLDIHDRVHLAHFASRHGFVMTENQESAALSNCG